MFKRLLAFTLAGCLVFDAAPVTSYAAGFQTNPAIETGAETAAVGEPDDGEQTEAPDKEAALERQAESAASEKSDSVGTGDGFGENEPGGYVELAEGEALADENPAVEEGRLPLTKNEDGSYTFETEDYRVKVLPEAGSLFLRFTVSLEAKEQMPSTAYNFPFVAYYKKSGSDAAPTEKPISLSYAKNYISTEFEQIESGEAYDVYFALKDYASSDTILGTTEAITLQTERTDKRVVVHGFTKTETDITFDVESDAWMNCYYAPADGSGEERLVSVYRGWNDLKLTGLQPGTEYKVQFVSGSAVLLETKASTAETATEVNWQITDAEETFGLSVKADVSKYMGTSTSGTIHCVYTNMLGEEKDSDQWVSFYGSTTEAEDGTKSFSAEYTVADGLLADTKYEFTVWIQIGNVIYGKTTQEVTTPHAVYTADDIEFTVNESESNPKTIECKVTNKNTAGGSTFTTAYLYYRREGDQDAYKKETRSVSSASPSTIYLSQLEYGATYHYVLLFGGVKKELTCKFGEPEVKLTAVGEGEVNAFDIVRTWKAESAEGAEALSGNYYLNLYYLVGNSYKTMGSSVILNEENAYQADFKTIDSQCLMPDTDYQLKWVLGKTATAGSYDAALYTFYETVHTGKADIKVEDEGDIAYDARRFKVTLAQEDTTNLAESGRSLYLYGWLGKAGSNSFRSAGSVSLSSGNSFSASLSFSNLDPETEYEVSLRSGTSYGTSAEYLSWKFTTPKDERSLTVARADVKLHSATLNYALSGILPAAEYGYISCFVREKSEGSEWERAGYNRSYSGTTGHTGSYGIDQYNGKELKDNTTYEYQIGFTTKYNATLSELAKITAGEFTTAEDRRALSGAGVSAGYTIAQVGAIFGGNDYNVSSYVYFFYREKGAEVWSRGSSRQISQVTAEYTSTVQGLKPGTDYEYVIVIANNTACAGPDDVTVERRKAAGTFTTKKSAYTLDFAADESKITYNKAVVTVSAKDSTEDDRVEAVLELNNGLSAVANLKRSSDYTRNITFTGLTGGTEYTVTKAVLNVTENDRKVTIAELPCDFKFTTKAAVAPASISLSEEKIGLNAADTNGDFYEDYNRKTLKVKAEPGTAAMDFVWESSNPEVATVQNGVVSARGVGEAKITVKSVYDETVTASCDVTVKNYVIGAIEQAGAEPDVLYYNSFGKVYKGGYVAGLGLYEQGEDGTLTPLSDYEVTTDKSGIVSWDSEAGRLQTLAVGTVRLYMEKEGVKASFSLTVTAAGKGFGITGFTTSMEDYPAIAGEEAGSYILAYTPGIRYKAEVEISPAQTYKHGDFEWKSSDENVATVDTWGIVTPVKAGDVTLTLTPKTFYTLQGDPYVQEKVELTLHIRELPGNDAESIYVLANTAGKIGDVSFPESWGEGWSWKYPNTPLVTNGVYSENQYQFEAVYKDGKSGVESRYPCEKTLNVYIGRITGMSVREIAAFKEHNHVLEVSDPNAVGGSADMLSLAVSPLWQGKVSADAYVVEMPEVNGLTITKNAETGYYDVTAQKAGNYTLNITIKAKDTDKVLTKTAYKIKAVADKQVDSILIRLDESSVSDGVVMNAAGNIIFTAVDDKKNFTLKASVRDKGGKELDTALQWKTSDKAVATVTAAKKDTHTVSVTVKGEGHAILTAKAKDATGHTVSLNLEVQNHRPRVDTSKATVNIAYDYENYSGRTYAASAGAVEIVPVYEESIKSVKLCDENGQPRTDLQAERYSYGSGGEKYLITPETAEIPTGTYNCKLVVTTNTDEEYSYNLKVSVVDKAPSVSAKMGTAPNLFFTDSVGRINLTVGDNRYVESVTWEDQSEGVKNGFALASSYYINKNKYVSYVEVSQQSNLRVTGGKLTDAGVGKGTLTVKVRGYRKLYTFNNFQIKYAYKKPNIVTLSASSNVVPAVGQNQGWFRFYDKTNKKSLYFEEDAPWSSEYDELTWDSEDVELDVSYNNVKYVYSGKTGTQKLTMTLDSQCWREPLKAVHTIKVIKPKTYLSASQLVFNAASKNTASVNVYLKNTQYDIAYDDLVVVGANPASKQLMENDLFLITTSGHTVTVSMNDAEMMGEKIKAGTYGFKVTPYCENPETGERTALNTVTLKVKVINKPVTAKVSPKGALNLTYGASSTPSDKKNYVVLADPKFSNMGSGYYVQGYKLVGEYSDYFSLNRGSIWYANKYGYHYYIGIKDRTSCKLKAGQTYKLAIEYTILANNGEQFTVTSNTFKIKPKQTAPKVTVRNNNQTMYVGAGGLLSRSYQLSVPDYYTISGATGSIDCNKDGKADITVSGTSVVTVRIADSDAVVASASGKTYSIPVTVRLVGRDGVSKDVKTTIKVKVKR